MRLAVIATKTIRPRIMQVGTTPGEVLWSQSSVYSSLFVKDIPILVHSLRKVPFSYG